MGIIIINSVIGIAQEMKVKNLVDKLSVITASKAKVIREQKEQEVPIKEVVIDDVMLVSAGDQDLFRQCGIGVKRHRSQ